MIKTYLAVAFSILSWSLAFLAIKIALRELSPMELFLLRHLPLAIGGIIYLSLGRLKEIKNILLKSPITVILASLCIPAYHLFLYRGQQRISPALATLIMGASPILTFAIAALIKYEKLTIKRLGGFLLAFIGLYCAIVWGGQKEIYVKNSAYLTFIFAAAIISASSTIINRELAFKGTVINVLALTISLGTLPFLLMIPDGFLIKTYHLQLSTIFAAAFLSFVSSFLAFVTWFYALKRLPATKIAIFINFVPFSTMLFGFLFLHETVTLWLAIGGLLIAAGAYWVNRHA